MAEAIKRHTAYKIWINVLHTGVQGDDPSGIFTVQFQDISLVRVNIVGNVIDHFLSHGYGSLLVDDGSGSIRVKVWGDDLSLLEFAKIGDIVMIIGRAAEFQGERYLRPEIIRTSTMDWALLRRLELVKAYGAPKKEDKITAIPENRPQPEVEPSLAAREAILNVIEKHEEVDEATLFAACPLSKEKVHIALQDLLKEGEVFSPKKGFYQLV